MPKTKFPPRIESRLAQNGNKLEARVLYGITPETACQQHRSHKHDESPLLRIIAVGPGEASLNILARYETDAALFFSIPYRLLEGQWKFMLSRSPQSFHLDIEKRGDRIHYVIHEIEKTEESSEIPGGYELTFFPEELLGRDEFSGKPFVDPEGNEVRCGCLTGFIQNLLPNTPYQVALMGKLGQYFAVIYRNNRCYLLAIPGKIKKMQFKNDLPLTTNLFVRIEKIQGAKFPYFYENASKRKKRFRKENK
ncbi:MAG: hypothetical protein HGA31_06125 [Candidatus Moranbacteria bacterium]|nr:hypothetical protein [Candidatus Moranbacteria bacterium]